jgi:hypothetical protein
MGIPTHEKGAVDLVLFAIVANRLGNGEDVIFVETAPEGASAMSGSAEADTLFGDLGIGMKQIIVAEKTGKVDEIIGWNGVPGKWMWHMISFWIDEIAD